MVVVAAGWVEGAAAKVAGWVIAAGPVQVVRVGMVDGAVEAAVVAGGAGCVSGWR